MALGKFFLTEGEEGKTGWKIIEEWDIFVLEDLPPFDQRDNPYN